ncbi:dihydroorotase [Solwaraspora sp. WMMB335]|uniref:dihydroorotase n=1 Tax=Solwaraspora sp. WMMB335 TaxID=3404118 RepID=UPI003B94FA3F
MRSLDEAINAGQSGADGGRWVIRGGRLLSADAEPVVVDLVIDGERVAAVEPAGTADAGPVFDAAGLDIAPGAIDLHVHLRDPGQTHKETVETGTAAAAAGGTTLVCDMPSTQPQVTTVDRYVAKRDAWTGRAAVDYALWAGGTDPDQLRGMAAAGAVGVKIYMATSPGFDQLYSPDDTAVRRVLRVSAELGWAVSVHAGDQAASDAHRAELIRAGRRTPADVLAVTRGPGNLAGLRSVLTAATDLRQPVHLAHLSAYGTAALDEFVRARAEFPRLTAESCFPALSEEEDLPRLGVYALPTVFSAAARDRFVDAIADGTIDAIATDHAPHTRDEKDPGRHDAWAAPPGYPALETSLPLAYDALLAGRLDPRRFVDALAGAPARILGLARKGRIAPGCDADLVLLDPAGSWRVDESTMHSLVGWSPLHGRELRGRLVATYLRGRSIARGGDIMYPGGGQFVRRSTGRAVAAGGPGSTEKVPGAAERRSS